MKIGQIAGLSVDDLKQLLALVLPLELGNPVLFGDDFQFVPGRVAFLLESAGSAIGLARAGGVGTARRSRGIARHGRSSGWCRGRIPPDEPEKTQENSQGWKKI
jgi:hypothetical protein